MQKFCLSLSSINYAYVLMRRSMKSTNMTILMSIFDGNMARNILRTDVLTSLQNNPNISRIVLLVHSLKIEEYTQEFKSGKVILDTYPTNLPSKAELITWFLVRHTIHTKNVRAKINELYFTSGGNWPVRFAKFLTALCTFYVTKIPVFDYLIRSLARIACNDRMFSELLNKHSPDLIFFAYYIWHK